MRVAIQKDVECRNLAENVVRICKNVLSLDYGESLAADQGCTVSFALDDEAVADLAYGRVIQVVDEDGTTEYRILKIVDSLAQKRVTVDARPILVDLSQVLIYATIGGEDRYTLTARDLTPEQWIDNYVIPALVRDGITWVTKGTVTPTGPITLQLDHQTALGLLRDLVVGTVYDVVLRRNGVTDYKIDLVQYNYTETKPLAWVGKNVIALDREIGGTEVTTIAKPVGIQPASAVERATVAGTVLKVTARSGTSVTIKDPRDNGDVIAGDDHLNGQYLTVPLPHGALAPGSVLMWGAWSAYSVLKDRVYVFDATSFFYGHEINPATGEITAYLDNALFNGEGGGISAVYYVPKGTSGKIWIHTGAKILELDCAALTVATVASSGAVQPTTRPIYHSGQDAMYYTNGSTMNKFLAVSPFTKTTTALTNAVHGMAYASSVGLFYCATNAASPAFRTFNPATAAVASVTPTGAGTYTQIEYDSGQDRLICSDDSDNGGLRIHLVNPNTNAITDTLTVTLAAGEANFGLNWGGTTDRLWSVAGGGKAWFMMKPVLAWLTPHSFGLRLVQVDVAAKTAVQLDHAHHWGFTRCTAYESDRAVLMLHGHGHYTLDPSMYCWEAKVQVSDTVDATDVVVVAGREKLFEAGNLLGIAAAPDGRRMTLMKHTGLIALYGPRTTVIDLSSFRGEKNLVKDPYCTEWFSAQWPKYPSHGFPIGRSANGTPHPFELRAKWDEYPVSTVTVHSFSVNGAHGAGATSISLDGGPASTVIPVGSRLIVPGNNTMYVLRRAVTDGSGVVTIICQGLNNAIADNDAATIRIPPLGGVAPNGVATYTQWAAMGSGGGASAGTLLGRTSVAPTSYPDTATGDELYTLRIRFGGYWGGVPKDSFQIIVGGRGQNFTQATRVTLDDDFSYPLGVRFLELVVGGYRKPGVYFDGIELLAGAGFTTDNLFVIDRIAVLQGVEPGTLALPPFTEYSHANQLWRAGKELLESGLQTYYALEVVADDGLRPFKPGTLVNIRDEARNIFVSGARLTNRRFPTHHPEPQTVRRPVVIVDTHVPSFAHLEPGPEGELSLSPPDSSMPDPDVTQTLPPPPVPPVATVVTDRIEVSSSVSLLEGATYGGTDVATKTWDPVPFDTVDIQIGAGLTLESDGRIKVARAGLYGVEATADYYNSILWDPTTPTWAQATFWVESSSPINQPFLGLKENPFDADATTSGIFEESYLVTGTRRVDAGGYIKAVIRSQRNSAGNHKVVAPTLTVWRIGDL